MILCERCQEHKPESEFWFDNLRGKIQKPCKDCRNKQKRNRRLVNRANGLGEYHDVKHWKDIDEIPTNIVEVKKDIAALNHKIRNASNVVVEGQFDRIVIYCTACSNVKTLPKMITGAELVNLIEKYSQVHELCVRKE